jgi:hypothetical protein
MVEGLHSEPNMEIANDRRLKIGEFARQTGLSIKTIRYYERRGLLEQPPRRADTASTVRKRSPSSGSSRWRSSWG